MTIREMAENAKKNNPNLKDLPIKVGKSDLSGLKEWYHEFVGKKEELDLNAKSNKDTK